MEICPHIQCTGCAACKEICPKQCITMLPDELASLHPEVDMSQCIDCGLCRKVCPNNHPLPTNKVQKVYAAWSNDEVQRLSSASGGIAYELYKFIIRQNGVGAGVVLDEDGCRFILVENEDDIKRTKNSKYVFSDTNGIYQKVRDRLTKGQKVLFIGLPCQVAGLYSYLRGKSTGLYTVDIICHGIAPYEYLEQHIKHIESKKKQRANTISFRDPRFKTCTYTFTISDKRNQVFYRKDGRKYDAWQLGYHRGLIYRENCYQCRYAQRDRVGDLTIGDFSGLGQVESIHYDWYNVSCVLCNTDKGQELIEQTKDSITYDERPPQEAFEYEHQLKCPYPRHAKREEFVKVYVRTKSFTKATNVCLKRDRLGNLISNCTMFVNQWTIRLPYRIYRYVRKKCYDALFYNNYRYRGR